jgi:hypothetical protein
LAVHHTDEELLKWGLSPDMVADQKWRANGSKGTSNDQSQSPRCLEAFFDLIPDSDDESEDTEDKTNSLSECSGQ